MLYTILQIIAFQTVFLLVYDLFLKRETFFNCNRVYLLVTSVLSLVLPFLKFPELQKVTSNDMVIQLPEVFIGTELPTAYEVQVAEQAGIILEQTQTPVWQTLAIVGIIFTTLVFVFKMGRLYWLKHRNPKRWYNNVLIVKLLKSSAAFSFFNTIFLGEQIPETDKATIYKHELIHVKERHTLDLLFFEILRIILWFNPLVYICQNRIKELHEFIADAKAVKQNGKTEYYQSLLNQIFDVNNISFTNTFFKSSLIKKRIAMLQKSKSKQLHLIKYTLLIPLVFGMLIYTSTEVKAQKKSENVKEVVSQELTDEDLIEKYYQEFLEMDKDDSEFGEIMDKMSFNTSNKYIESREGYLKLIAFGRYMMQTAIEKKSENGKLTQNDIDRMEDMKSNTKSYAEFREWKKTQEAKNLWEASAKYGELRLVVNEIGNKTKVEQKRFDALIEQLNYDRDFHKLIVCEVDSASSIVLYASDQADSDNKQIKPEVNQFVEVPFSVIEEVPTTIECKDLPTNNERKRCISTAIQKHVNKNFNTSIADSLELNGKQRIFVAFKIGKKGEIAFVNARAAHPALEDEAERVIKILPTFIPGRQKGKTVVVPYSLPIVFQTSKTPKYDQFVDSLGNENVIKLKALKEQRDRILKNSSERNPVAINLKKQIDSINHIIEEEVVKAGKEKSDEKNTVPFSLVEIAPTHPDCKTLETNEDRKRCTSAEVQKMVNREFNKDLAGTLDLPDGRQKIFGAFTIDKQGFVKDAKAMASHEKLEEEFIRVINLLPQFIPGETKGKKVDVPFSLPIVFQLANSKKKKD